MIFRGAGLAPMAGVTDAAARLLAIERGAAFSVTEMISAKGLSCMPDGRAARRLMARAPRETNCGAQLFGHEPALMREAAARLSEAGFAYIDINMGCPAHKIVGGGEGSALMREPKLAQAVAAGAVAGARTPVTVKLRSGWDAGSVNAPLIAKMCEDAGVAAVCVHPRTRDQFYSGRADWRVIGEVARAVHIPVIGNGDIVRGADALAMLEATGCQAVMVGRAARGNPWIFDEINASLAGEDYSPPPLKERMATALRHMDMLAALVGERLAVLEMRGHLPFYLRGAPGATKLRVRINEEAAFSEVRRLLLEEVF